MTCPFGHTEPQQFCGGCKFTKPAEEDVFYLSVGSAMVLLGTFGLLNHAEAWIADILLIIIGLVMVGYNLLNEGNRSRHRDNRFR